MFVKKITPEQTAYVLEHRNDRPRAAVARAAGIALSSLYLILRHADGVERRPFTVRNAEWERIVRENYAGMSGHEIERRYGFPRNRANKIARRLGLKHSDETLRRLKAKQSANLTAARQPQYQEKRRRTWLVRRRLDEIRVLSGEPQRTRHKFRQLRRGVSQAKSALCKKYGYWPCEGEPLTLLYDEETRRPDGTGWKRKSEEYYTERYGLIFCKADE